MNKQIEEMRNDVQEALKHNSAVDAIRHGLICVNSDGIARELFDDGYRRAADMLREVEKLGDLYQMPDGMGLVIKIKDFAELKKKYESEGADDE